MHRNKSIDIYRFLDASDIAVFPASQSILWQQAISMHLPLIVGDTGSQSISYLNKYENIVILEKNNITKEKLILNIDKLLNNESLIKQMSIGAEKITSEMLDWNNLIFKTLKYEK